VSAFGLNRSDGRLELLNTVRSGGPGPTYISVHPGGRHLLVANYHGGSVAVLPIADDGRLAEASDVKADAGTVGPARAPHAPPGSFAFSGHDRTHAHMIQADPSGRFVIHTDLGLDRIDVWKFDAQRGVLTPNDPPSVALPPGDGPRHFSFHPNGRWFYSIQEEGSTLVLFDYDGASGRLTARRRSRRCRPALPAATSARRSWCLPMGASCTPATGSTTASGSSPSVGTAR
jgi:6-phosphogluconolactonase (cycloisomerase 2 family)